MSWETLVRLLAGAALIGANAFFVAVEFALTRLRGLDLSDEEIQEGGLSTAWELTERLEIHLTGCQLGISSTSVLLGVVAEPAITELIEPVVALVGLEGASVRGTSVVVAVILLNLVHKIWGEQAPTYLGVERPKEVARRLAPVLAVWSRVMRPVVKLGDGAAKSTLRLFGVEVTRSWLEEESSTDGAEPAPGERSELVRRLGELLSGEVPEDRRGEILQALRMDDIPARDIMVPADEVIWLRLDEDARDHLGRLEEHRLVRYPVLAAGAARDAVRRDEVAGQLYLPAVFTGDRWPGESGWTLEPFLTEPLFLSADLAVSRLVDRLQEERQELAILTDPDDEGRVVGIVTVSDAFEVIAGELWDPLDREG